MNSGCPALKLTVYEKCMLLPVTVKEVRAQKFPRTDLVKLATQKGNDPLLPKR